jgi:hypothetical protein
MLGAPLGTPLHKYPDERAIDKHRDDVVRNPG